MTGIDVCKDETLRYLAAEQEENAPLAPIDALCWDKAATARALAVAYVNATSYMFPLMQSCVAGALALQRKSHPGSPLYLLLRDALCFWPAVQAHREQHGPVDVYFVSYTRRQEELQIPMRMLRLQPDGTTREVPAHAIEDGVVLDVGLYGTLIKKLVHVGQLSRRASVLFLCSRNPFISGWFNELAADAITRGAPPIDVEDYVRLSDTIETLFKPFRWMDPDGIALTEPVALVCSMAYHWALYRFARAHEPVCDWSVLARAIAQARDTNNRWFLAHPIPRWSGAEKFLGSWTLGPISPHVASNG